jgi:hypothetical protein
VLREECLSLNVTFCQEITYEKGELPPVAVVTPVGSEWKKENIG